MSEKRYQGMRIHGQSSHMLNLTRCGLVIDDFESSVASGGREYSLRLARAHHEMTCKRCIASLQPAQFPPRPRTGNGGQVAERAGGGRS